MEYSAIRQMAEQPLLINNPNPGNVVLAAILKAYALTGLSRTLSIEVMREEAAVITSEITKDIISEKDFRTLRVPEVDYAICSGIKGDFAVQTYSLSYQTMYKWLRAYIEHPDRKRAIESYIQDKHHKQLVAHNEPSEQEQEQIIINGINESYATYLEMGGKTTGAFPPILDLGGVKDRYLTAKGFKPASISLEQYYKNCSRQGKKKII